jgi:hypothetical protein
VCHLLVLDLHRPSSIVINHSTPWCRPCPWRRSLRPAVLRRPQLSNSPRCARRWLATGLRPTETCPCWPLTRRTVTCTHRITWLQRCLLRNIRRERYRGSGHGIEGFRGISIVSRNISSVSRNINNFSRNIIIVHRSVRKIPWSVLDNVQFGYL